MNVSRTAASLLALASLAGCARQARPPLEAPTPLPLCQLSGSWTTGELRTARGGYPFADVWGAHAEAIIDRAEGPLRLHVILTKAGWTLEGRLDPEEDEALRVRAMTPLIDGVTLAPGAAAHLVDARSVGPHRAELLIGLPRFALTADDGVHFPMPPRRWVGCDDVGFSFAFRSPETEAAERVALGLPSVPAEGRLPPGQVAALSVSPGGAPFVELGPTELGMTLFVLDAQGAYSRVLVHHWTGAMLMGWLPTSALSAFDASEEGGLGGILGSFGGDAQTLTVCVSPAPLDLFAARGDEVEPIGRVDAGVRFVRGDMRADGAFSIRPHPSDGVGVATGAVWIARGTGLICGEEQHDPMAALRGTPSTTLAITVSVTLASGLPNVAPGGSCEVSVEHYPGAHLACRATVRCGDAVLFGQRSSNGYFECSVTGGATPVVSGRDSETSERSGDAAMSIDTQAHTFSIEDDAAGANGAFHLEGRITTITDTTATE